MAFPALHVPKDTAFFCNLNEKTAGYVSKWKALYAQAIRKRGCYLVKQTPTQTLLLEEDLTAAFEKVKETIPKVIHPAVETFIQANSGWNQAAADLAVCEWELLKPLFNGLKREEFNIGKATLEFYDEREADLLTGDERDYLARLRDRSRSEAQEFFEELKEELSHPYYLEIVLGWHAMKPELLSLTDRPLDYSLDDYAEWLGQREEQSADILAISPEQTPDGQLNLAVIIAESKYIDVASVATKRKESQKQLRDTVRRINDAIFGDPQRLDRDLWLSRFSDLMLNGIQFPANSPIDLAAWRKAVSEGECFIHLRGYSHIFVSGPSESAECSDFATVAEAEHSYQEVFSRARLRELTLSYWKDTNPTPIRKDVAGEDIWQERPYRKPSDRIQIVHRRKSDNDSPGGR